VVTASIALVVAPTSPAVFTIDHTDREAVAWIRRASVPIAVLGIEAHRANLQRCADQLGPGIRVLITDKVDADAFDRAARELDVIESRLYAIVENDKIARDARRAGAFVVQIGRDAPTLRDGIERLAAAIVRSAVIVRAFVAQIGVET